MSLDRRLTPARPDLADIRLQGQVEADRFVEGTPARVIEAVLPLRVSPRPDAVLDTEAVYGDRVTVFDTDDEGWAWVQLDRDGYVGYAPVSGLLNGASPAPTHKVAVLRTFLFPGATIKEPPLGWLSYGSEVIITREAVASNGRRFLVTANGGAIVAHHLVPIDATETDAVAIAERFLGTPYLWGGKSSLGIDCSGLVQTALRGIGVEAPRDADMQEKALGRDVGLDRAMWRRGDLMFWPGHVAFVRDADTIIHANGKDMAVAVETIDSVLARTAAAGEPLRRVARL
jgi:cell wall-associated NlpC family hydrolase